MRFQEFFRIITATDENPGGRDPYPYQIRMADSIPELVDIPTGLGKTEAVIAAWLWRLIEHVEDTPRRLIYSLPMRSLVEQTEARAQSMVVRLRIAGLGPVPSVNVVMGGDVGDEWFKSPDAPSIVIGTQDMLLSRALNRGYAMSRFQWPMDFGAINNDALWVIDEVQLHGIGAVTAAQLQGLREKLGTVGPVRTVFMSATLDASWLDTVDHRLEGRATLSLQPEDLASQTVARIVNAKKSIVRLDAADESAVAEAIVERHRPGTLTLAILNTVDRARAVFKQVERRADSIETVLLHSRFRPGDRAVHAQQLFAPLDPQASGRIVVATQVVEAGVDVDAGTLITDVAPWSSIVQRFGRCNRRGQREDAVCYWIDAGQPIDKSALPYALEPVVAAREVLIGLEGKSGAPYALPKLPISLEPGLVLRRVDLLDLFDTSPDLSGHDVDISRFIRQGDDIAAHVLWRDEPPSEDFPPHRDELCPAPVFEVRKLLKRLAEHGQRGDARAANQFGGFKDHGPPAWVPIDARSVRPGMQIWLRSDVGWYDQKTGFGELNRRVAPVEIPKYGHRFEDECTTIAGDRNAQIGAALTLSRHAVDVRDEANAMAERLAGTLTNGNAASVARAALWHDVGKAHPIFRDSMARGNSAPPPTGEFWAKCVNRVRHKRPGFRHELASTLAFLHTSSDSRDGDLIAYLIAAHHGKLRVMATPLPSDAESATQRLLGNEVGEDMPAVRLCETEGSAEFKIDLSIFRVGSDDGVRT
ncbi:MAG: type I-G CRISPR-associated helicase/endonuclease Cas3g [Vulcanimicrobiaceae bacterium]